MSLKGLRVVEMAGLAPGPFCGMVLADHGASIVRVCKTVPSTPDTLARGKRSIAINLKQSEGVDIVRRLCKNADVLIEPFRKGVMEKLGLGPHTLCEDNPRLIYARLTGFGQKGVYSNMAGHDINYIATSGVLSSLGRANSNPHAPANILADFAGGGLMCSLGILLALVERSRSGRGQVIDSNMVHGSAYVSSFLWASRNADLAGLGLWNRSRGENFLDGGAPFYDTYKTKDGKFMAVGAIEPQFYAELLQGLGLDDTDYPQLPQEEWKATKEKFAEVFLTKTQSEWANIFDGTDACVTPVLDLEKAHLHPQNEQNFIPTVDGKFSPSPAPNLSRTPGTVSDTHHPKPNEHTVEILQEVGLSSEEITRLAINKTIRLSKSDSKL